MSEWYHKNKEALRAKKEQLKKDNPEAYEAQKAKHRIQSAKYKARIKAEREARRKAT